MGDKWMKRDFLNGEASSCCSDSAGVSVVSYIMDNNLRYDGTTSMSFEAKLNITNCDRVYHLDFGIESYGKKGADLDYCQAVLAERVEKVDILIAHLEALRAELLIRGQKAITDCVENLEKKEKEDES